jgi:glutathione S-transferase
MLKLYHYPISYNSRRVWVALLEKNLEFELVSINLNGEQLQPEFLELNPFHHIPVLVDNGFRVLESLAILDYLEAKYPTPALLPTDAETLATVRMVEMVTVNELIPALSPLNQQWLGLGENNSQKLEQAKQQIATVLTFFEQLLGKQNYFGKEHLTLAEVVAGTVVSILPFLGVSLSEYPQLNAWIERLNQRPARAITQPSLKEIEAAKSDIAVRMAARMAAQRS